MNLLKYHAQNLHCVEGMVLREMKAMRYRAKRKRFDKEETIAELKK